MRSRRWLDVLRLVSPRDNGAVIRRLLALLLFVAVSPAALALDPRRTVDEFTVTAWTMEEGLTHNYVQAITQDGDGFLWVGTYEGAGRFDGRRFASFGHNASADFPLSGVTALLAEANGNVLLGTAQHGVVRYQHGEWSRLEDTFRQGVRVVSLLHGSDGSVWIGGNDALYRSDALGDTLIRIGAAQGLPDGQVTALLEIPDHGGLLIGTPNGLYRWREDHPIEPMGKLLGIGNGAVRTLLLRRDGSIVAGTGEGAFAIDSGLNGARQISQSMVEAALEDRDGALWMLTSGDGLIRDIDGTQESIGEALGLQGRGGHGLFEDREGLLWAGTTNGLFRISDGAVFGLDRARGLADDYARSILRRPDGSMLIGHARGLDVWRSGRIESVGQGGKPASVLTLVAARDGGYFAGTYDRGVLKYPPESNAGDITVIDQRAGLRSNHIRAVAEATDGTVYVGTTNGMSIVRDGRVVETLNSAQGLPGDYVRTLLLGNDGGLWIGTSNGLAYRSADGSLQVWKTGVNYPAVSTFDLYADREARLWIGSDAGLLRLRGDGSFAVYDHRAGLPNDSIFRVMDDGEGNFWLSSNKGAFRIPRAQFREIDSGEREALSIDAFDRSDGMPSSQCNGGNAQAGDFDAFGRVWLPTSAGVAVIDPAATAAQSLGAVPVKIVDVLIDGIAQPLVDAYTLEPGNSRIVIRYAGLNFRAPLRVRYRYRMHGFDRDWIDAGSSIEAIYTNLSVGHLNFEVQATMNPSGWDETAPVQADRAGVAFVVTPPYWQKPWFAGVVIAALALMIALVSWIRAAGFRRRQASLSRTIERRTRELSDKNAALEHAGREREKLLRQLEYQATHDALTGLLNRGAGGEQLAAEMAEASSDVPMCVALVDIDHFKRVNDDYGHNVGDALLRHVALALASQESNAGGIVSRHGGEEFLIVMPGATLAEASYRMGSVVEHISRTPLEHPDMGPMRVTISVGVAQWVPGVSASRLTAAADRRLYRAKREGRNRVVISD